MFPYPLSTKQIISNIQHQVPPKLVGNMTCKSLIQLHKKLCDNFAIIDSNLGRFQWVFIYLVFLNIDYLVQMVHTFFVPIYPVTTPQEFVHVLRVFEHQKTIYHTCHNFFKSLIHLITTIIEYEFLKYIPGGL